MACLKTRGFLAALCGAFCLSAFTAHASVAASASKEVRACKASDLSGTWRMKMFEEKPYGWRTDYVKRIPFQYMYFTDNGSYMSVGSNMEYRNQENISSLLRLASGESGYSYEVDSKGVVALRENGKVIETHRCQVVVKAGSGYEIGDVIFHEIATDTDKVIGDTAGTKTTRDVYRIFQKMQFSKQ